MVRATLKLQVKARVKVKVRVAIKCVRNLPSFVVVA